MDSANATEAPPLHGAGEHNDDGRQCEGIALPPEVLTAIVEYLHFDTILSCGAVSRSMLHDVMPRLTRLRVDNSHQLNLAVASRFRDVKSIQINSVLTRIVDEEGFSDVRVDSESGGRVVHFLSRFGKLERVHFGVQTEDGDDVEGFSPVEMYFCEDTGEGYPNECDREAMLAFLDGISRGFCCRALPENLEIIGLCCPDAANGNYSNNLHQCSTCMNACRKFPLDDVVRFECKQSSIDSARSGRSYGLDVCIERARVESIIESRPGGRDLLRSEERLFYLLGRGRLYNIASADTRTVRIVKYKQEQLDEIKRVIEYAELDVKKLSMQKLSDAVMKSFAKDENDPIPAKCDRYFAGTSLDYLVKEVGLNLDRNEICSDASELLDHPHQIAWVLSEAHTRATSDDESNSDDEDYEDILVDCLRLVRQFSELDDSHIHQITDAIPSLVTYLNDTGQCEKEAVVALSNILKNGTAEHRKMVLEAKPISSFRRMLGSRKSCIAKAAVLALDNIVMHEGIEEVIRASGPYTIFIDRLVRLLDSEDDDCVLSALRVLAPVDEVHLKVALERSGLFPHISRLMLSPDANGTVLANCTILLRKILEHPLCGKPHVERVIDSNLVPRLVELVRSEDDAVETNSTNVVILLAAGASDKMLDILVREEGLLSVLVSLVDSSDDEISVKATSALGNIADDSVERCKVVLEAGVATPLLRLLKRSASTTPSSRPLLETATKTLSILCCNGSFEPAEAKTVLEIGTQLLSNSDKDIAANSCWTLYHLLDGMGESNLGEAIDKGFVRKIIKLLAVGLHEVQVPALETVHLIASADEGSIQCIADCNGIACIKKALFSSHDNVQKLACLALSVIVAGDKHQIQAAVDAKVVPCLFQVLASGPNKTHALKAIHAITEGGTAAQIDYLVGQGCVDRLCDTIDPRRHPPPQIQVRPPKAVDYVPSTLALRALKNILKVGKKAARPSVTTQGSLSYSSQMMERKLEDIEEETLELQRETRRVLLLQRKEAWLEVDALEAKTETLKGAYQILQEQHQQEDQLLQSFEQKIAGVGSDTLSKANFALRQTKDKAMEMLSREMRKVEREQHQSTIDLSCRLEKAERIAPKSEWYERLANDEDLPADLETVSRELEKSRSTVNTLEATRASDQRKLDLHAIRTGLRRLFKNKEAPTKRAASDVTGGPASEPLASKKKKHSAADSEPSLGKKAEDENGVIDLCDDSDTD